LEFFPEYIRRNEKRAKNEIPCNLSITVSKRKKISIIEINK
jgi:hypothetical protein